MAHYRTIEEMYSDGAPESLLDPITHCIFCDPVVSSSTGKTYSKKTVTDFGNKDPYSMQPVGTLIPNRNMQEVLDEYYKEKFKETLSSLVDQPIDWNVDRIIELVAMVVNRSDLQICLDGQRLLVEVIQSSADSQLLRFKERLSATGLNFIGQLVEKQTATELARRLGIGATGYCVPTAGYQPPTISQPVRILSPIDRNNSDEEGEDDYDFSDTESTTSSVGYTEDKTYVFVGKMPAKTTFKDVLGHFSKFRDSMTKRVMFIKGSNQTMARLTFTSSAVASDAIELLNRSVFPNSSSRIVVKLWVNKKRERQSKDAKPSSPRKHSEPEAKQGVEGAGKRTDVYVGNLPSSATEDDIRSHFKKFKPRIRRVEVIKDPKTKTPKGFARVIFSSLEAAQAAVTQLHKSQMPQSEQRLIVNIWKEKSDKQTKPLPEESAPNPEKKRGRKKKEEKESPPSGVAIREVEPVEKWVGMNAKNVSVNITGDQLRTMLGNYGTVKQFIVTPAPEGKDVYKATVYYSSKAEADEAIAELNEKKLAGETIYLDLLSESASSPVKSPGAPIETFGVYVGKIPKSLGKSELEQIFAKYGKISSTFLKPGNSFAYVNYYNLGDAQAALDMNNREVHGNKLRVNMATKKGGTSSTSDDPTPSLPAVPPSPSKPVVTTPSMPASFTPSPSKPETTPSMPASFTIQIKRLSSITTKESLSSVVQAYGVLSSPVHIINGNPRYAYVNYTTLEAANKALSYLHNYPLDGSLLQVKVKSKMEMSPPPVSPAPDPLQGANTYFGASPVSYSPPTMVSSQPYQFPQLSTPSLPSHPPPPSSLQSPSSMMKNIPMSARLNQFLNERMDLKLREFKSFGGSVEWQNNMLVVFAPSIPILGRFEEEVLKQFDEHRIPLISEDWNKLMQMRPDKTSAFQQLMLPYRTNDNVCVEPDNSSLVVCVVGMKGAVQDVVATITAELNKEIVVEQEKMMTLLKLNPTLKEQAQNNFGALMEGFSFGSTKISFTGSSHAVSQAREWFNSLLKQYIVASLLCRRVLIPSALDRMSTELLSVVLCVKCDDGTICYAQYLTVKTVQVVLLVCGSKPFVERAVEIFNRPEERIITFDTMEALHKMKSQPSYDFSSLSEQHQVYIQESTGPVLTIQSYSKNCIAAVESILNQAKVSLERCSVVLQGSKAKIAHLTAAFAQHPDQAKIFFDAIYQATSVETLCLDKEVRLTGSMDKIKEAEKMINNSDFLKGFKCETFEFECHPNFKGQTEKYLKSDFDRCQLDIVVRCYYQKTEKLSRQTSKGDLTKSKSAIFYVEIESENDAHFATASGIMKGLKPETRYIRMPKKEFECLSHAVKSHVLDIEGTHKVRLDLYDKSNTAVIHGLTATEINAAEDEIGAYVSANVEIKLTVKVSKHQKYYLTGKCNKLQDNNCKILFPKLADFKKENAGDTPQADITLQGEKCHVEVAKQKIDEILSSLHHRLVKKRHNQYAMMWKRKWEEVKSQEEANSNVVIFTWFDFDEKEKGQKSKKPKEVGVGVEITIISDDFLVVCQVEQNVVSVADTIMTRPILASRNQCKAVADALKNKKLILRESHNVELEIDWDKPELLLLAPSGSSDDFEGASATLLAFIHGEAVKSDNIKLGEPALSHYIHQKQQWSEIIKVAKQCSVRVKHNNRVLEVSGKVPDVVRAKGLLEQLLQTFSSHLGTQEVSVSSLYEPVLKTLEFQNLVSRLRQDLCVAVTFHNVQRSKNTVTLCKANIQPEGCDRPCFIEICYGNLVNETTDVIVNAANSELQHIGGLAKAISDAGGPAIQAYSDDYVRQNGIVKPGHLACLPAGNLSCSVVMHAVGPMWKDGGHSKKEELYAAVSTSLVESDKRGYRSVSLPAISAGIYGCPVKDCALLSIKATADLLIGNCLKSVSHIRFVLFTWDAANAFQDSFKDCLLEDKSFRATAEVVAQPFPSSGVKAEWFWEDDTKRLQPYTSQVSVTLSHAYSVSPNQALMMQIEGQEYTIYFADMVQVNNRTQKRRRVHRRTLGAITWQYKDDNNSWAPYAPEHNDVLEVMYESKVPQRLEIGNWSYAIDFQNMEQINFTTRKRRPIRRVVGSVATPGKALLKQTSVNASLSLNGPHQNLAQACKMAENCFERCLTSCEIPLSDSLSYLAEKIKRLGHKYNVEAKYIPHTKTVTFRGVADGVTKARLAAQDILLSVGSKSNVKFPPEWETDANSPNVVIVEVRSTSHEWRRVSQLVLSTLPQVNVLKIERVQNRWLWEKYILNCKRMKEKNKGVINEKELFHGTSGTSPDKIYADEEEGFDMRFGRQGMWGQGNYFAEKAEYSDTYAYQGHNGLKQFFLAKVLTGDSILMKSDGKLRMPPLKSGGGNVRYDTVCGVTHGCRVYIAYSNDKAYPFYLITYKYKGFNIF